MEMKSSCQLPLNVSLIEWPLLYSGTSVDEDVEPVFRGVFGLRTSIQDFNRPRGDAWWILKSDYFSLMHKQRSTRISDSFTQHLLHQDKVVLRAY